MKKIFLLLSLLWLISSCTPTPEPIEYGADMCDFCKMSIVDAQHGAEFCLLYTSPSPRDRG